MILNFFIKNRAFNIAMYKKQRKNKKTTQLCI